MSDDNKVEDSIIPCLGCAGNLKLDGETERLSHIGPHSMDCPWKKIEPVNWQVLAAYRQGLWEFDENGESTRYAVPEGQTPPVSNEQFKNNVIKVDFENKKRIE